MKDYWGGFMKKRIICKVIKSIPLCKEDVISSYGDISKMRNLLSFSNSLHAKSEQVTYTKTMEIEIGYVNKNLTEKSIDFYA